METPETTSTNDTTDDSQPWAFALIHIETQEYVCLRQQNREFVALFTNRTDAVAFRNNLRLLEYVDLVALRFIDAPFDAFWLDGAMIERDEALVVKR